MFQRLLRTSDMRAIALIRLLVGWVFVVEGILKFQLPDELGVGQFATIEFLHRLR